MEGLKVARAATKRRDESRDAAIVTRAGAVIGMAIMIKVVMMAFIEGFIKPALAYGALVRYEA